MESRTLAIDAPFDAGFSPAHAGLLNLLPQCHFYGAISTFRRVRTALWPMQFPVYASVMLFPHPLVTASGNMFGNAVSSAHLMG